MAKQKPIFFRLIGARKQTIVLPSGNVTFYANLPGRNPITGAGDILSLTANTAFEEVVQAKDGSWSVVVAKPVKSTTITTATMVQAKQIAAKTGGDVVVPLGPVTKSDPVVVSADEDSNDLREMSEEAKDALIKEAIASIDTDGDDFTKGGKPKTTAIEAYLETKFDYAAKAPECQISASDRDRVWEAIQG